MEFKIGDKVFTPRMFKDKAEVSRYMSWIEHIARKSYDPLEWFTSNYCKNLKGEDRAAAIAGFMARSDWRKVPSEIIAKVQNSWPGTRVLCAFILEPEVQNEEIDLLVTPDNWEEVTKSLIKYLRPPTDEEIVAANTKLKEQIKAAKEKQNY